MITAAERPRQRKRKVDHNAVEMKPLCDIRPSPENDTLYRPVDPNDPSIISMAESMRTEGVKEPFVTDVDGWILSGHRRFVAATLAGLTHVPRRIDPTRRSDGIDAFIVALTGYNKDQRVKTLDEQIRESIVCGNADDAYQELTNHRRETSKPTHAGVWLNDVLRRCEISPAKYALRDAIISVLNGLKDFWPVSDRQIHYGLLNAPPLRHSSKPASRYQNNLESYGDLTDMVTRMRLDGTIPFHAIGDASRLSTSWDVHAEPGAFVSKEIANFLKGYFRNLQQSQPCHIEVLGEKNTVYGILRPVCAEFCLPLTSGKGYCSLPPRHAMAQRFRKSGKDRLILLMMTDFDGDGESIAESYARSMRDDFGIANITPLKVALNADQVKSRDLPAVMTAKASSKQTAKFVAKHGSNVWELEALKPEDLQGILRTAIVSVLDIEAFNAEQRAEADDAVKLKAIRETVQESLKSLRFDSELDE